MVAVSANCVQEMDAAADGEDAALLCRQGKRSHDRDERFRLKRISFRLSLESPTQTRLLIRLQFRTSMDFNTMKIS